MSILMTNRHAYDLALIWVNSARGIGKSKALRGLIYKSLILFLNWLDKHGLWLMTHNDILGQTLYFEELEEELKNIRKRARNPIKD